jgi:MinD-like ATPase involved in chromosome partitioning or flagellar assembly
MTDFEIDGIKRGFKLGTYTFKLINQVSETKTIQDVIQKLTNQDEEFTSIFYFCCAKHWAMANKIPIDFEEVHVADWMDELGSERMKEITGELFKVYISKNLKAPAMGHPAPLSNGTH